jgi:hypothetical protein
MLNAAIIQLIAMLSMTIDHVGLYLCGNNGICRIIGRIAFPLFTFMLVEGFKHTHSRKRYCARIIVTAFVAELIVFSLASITHTEYMHNILFTFAFALAALSIAERGGFMLILIPIIALIPGALNCEYGAYGVFLVVGLYYADKLFSQQYILRSLAQFIIVTAITLSLVQYESARIMSFGILATLPIVLYSGKKGHRLPHWLSYAFYPAHLLIILVIRLMLY